MTTDAGRRHANLLANFFSQLAVAFVAGAFLQVLLPETLHSARTATLLMTGFALLGTSHIVIEGAFGAEH